MDARIKTFLLLAILTAVALWAGSLFGTGGLYIAIAIVIVMNLVSYFASDKIALSMYKAKEVSEKEQPELHKVVAEVAHAAHVPKPRVFIIPSNQSNAFASGRNPEHGILAVTVGIMKVLNRHELKGVIAHEIAHIKNRDILVTTVAAMIAGVISYLATMAQWAAIFGGFSRDGEGSGIIEFLAMIILAPIIAMIIRMAVSRTREYYADKEGAKYNRDPYSLANALEKIEAHAKKTPLGVGPEGGEALFIINPFVSKTFVQFLSTHPPTEERVKRLRNMRV